MLNQLFISQEFGDLAIAYAGKEKCKPLHSHSCVHPGEFLIHYITEGKGVVKYDDREYQLEKGNAFLIGDKKGHYCADEKEPWTYIWIRFSGELAKRFVKTVGLSLDKPIYKTTSPDKITGQFEEFLALGEQNNEFLFFGKFLTLLGEMVRLSANEVHLSKNSTDRYINICRDFVAVNYGSKITAHDLANVVRLEYSYLFRLFKEYINMSPGEYIINYKLSKAAAMLTDSDMSVSEIAASVGYDDRIAFSKLFKKRYGVSPKDYKKGK